jgi:predicted transcriptional regulator YdeE
MKSDVSFEERGLSVLWDKFFARFSELGIEAAGIFYGVSTPADENIPTLTMHYLAGAAAPDSLVLPEGFSEFIVPAGKYLFFTHAGPIEGIGATANELYTNYLPSSGLVPRSAPHLELYDERFDHESATCEMDLLVPIQ